MHRWARLCIVPFIVVGVCDADLQAQGFSLSIGGLYDKWSSSQFVKTLEGYGPELRVRYHATPWLGVSIGAQRSSHDVDFSSSGHVVTAFIVEPRIVLPVRVLGPFSPYLGVGIARTYASYDDGSKITANATAVGPTGGVELRLQSSMRLDLGVSVLSASFGDSKSDGASVPASSFESSFLTLRAAVVFQFGQK